MLYIENYEPYVMQNGGLASNKPATFGGTVATGALTVTGNATVSGTLAVTGAITGPRTTSFTTSALVGATVVLTASQSGGTFQNVSTSGSPSWTLPTAAVGLEFTFLTGNTTAGFTVTSSTAVIHAKTSATGTAITTTTTLTNTQATAVVGDAITIVCDGTAWWIKSQTGIFAAS